MITLRHGGVEYGVDEAWYAERARSAVRIPAAESEDEQFVVCTVWCQGTWAPLPLKTRSVAQVASSLTIFEATLLHTPAE